MAGATVASPRSLGEAVSVLADWPDAVPVAGGTDVMVAVNTGRLAPSLLVNLAGVPELAGFRREDDHVILGANLTYTQLAGYPLAGLLPALAQAARAVGSPQIRNVGTLGGAIGTAASAGDVLPALIALDASVACFGPDGWRQAPLADVLPDPVGDADADAGRGPLGAARLQPGEVVVALRIPAAPGAQEYLRVGERNAMSRALVSVALVLDMDRHAVRCAVGGLHAAPVRATEAEALVCALVDWRTGQVSEASVPDAFGRLVARGGPPPAADDRAQLAYRRDAVAVCARRALVRATAGPAIGSSGPVAPASPADASGAVDVLGEQPAPSAPSSSLWTSDRP